MNAKELGAQPCVLTIIVAGDVTATQIAEEFKSASHKGLTKRELAAFMAMQGFVGYPPNGHVDGKGDDDDIARLAVRYADALLAELAKDQP